MSTRDTDERLREAEAMFRAEEPGPNRAASAAEWLLAAVEHPAPPADTSRHMLDEVRSAALALPDALAEFTDALRDAYADSDEERADYLRTLAYDHIILRDVLEDLREASTHLDRPDVRAALESFDAGLDDADPWIHTPDADAQALRELRLRMGRRPGKGGRRWWEPLPTADSLLEPEPEAWFAALHQRAGSRADPSRADPSHDAAGAGAGDTSSAPPPETESDSPKVVHVQFSPRSAEPLPATGTDFEGAAPVPDWRAEDVDVDEELPASEDEEILLGVGRFDPDRDALVVDFVDDTPFHVEVTASSGASPILDVRRSERRWVGLARPDALTDAVVRVERLGHPPVEFHLWLPSTAR